MPLQGYHASMVRTPKKIIDTPPRRGRAEHTAADDLVKAEVGTRLKQIRKIFGCNQDQMANVLGLPPSTYKKYEQGTIFLPPSLFRKLAELDVNIHYLMIGVGDVFMHGRPMIPRN